MIIVSCRFDRNTKFLEIISFASCGVGCDRESICYNTNFCLYHSPLLNDRVRVDRCEIPMVLLLHFNVPHLIHIVRHDGRRSNSEPSNHC